MKLKLQNWIKFSTKLEGVTFNLDDQKFNVYVYVYIYINVYEIFIKKKNGSILFLICRISTYSIHSMKIFFRQKCKTDPPTFNFCHFSPLTFNFVISIP